MYMYLYTNKMYYYVYKCTMYIVFELLEIQRRLHSNLETSGIRYVYKYMYNLHASSVCDCLIRLHQLYAIK